MQGVRDLALISFYLDTACRHSEDANLQMEDLDIQAGRAKVVGKGQRERYVFFGINVRKTLWKYVKTSRPEPESPFFNNVFLTHDGRPLGKKRVEAIVKKYGQKAGITGVRLSPHTLRHTACVMYVRNRGDLFSLQALTGHSSLTVLRNYVNLDDADLQAAHTRYSPIDNLRYARRKAR